MRSSRKKIWGSVLLFALFSFALIMLLVSGGTEFSVVRKNNATLRATSSIPAVSRYPLLDGPPIAIVGGGTATNGLSLRALLPSIKNREKQVFAIRSLGGVYPDGSCERYEVLYGTNGTVHRFIVGIKGVESDQVLEELPPVHTTLPLDFPDSKEAMLQLTTNHYFKEAHATGIALYYDATAKRWSYIVRTDLGDVNILLR